jgi:hypothetical protein
MSLPDPSPEQVISACDEHILAALDEITDVGPVIMDRATEAELRSVLGKLLKKALQVSARLRKSS